MRTYYTFEFNNAQYLMTSCKWENGKIHICGLGKDGTVIGPIEMQYGVFFTGSIDSIDSWMDKP